MMKFAVPTNFRNNFISRLNKKGVHYLYGKLAADFVGGGRASVMLASVSKRRLAKHVAEVHKNGLEFNYLLNASCLGNREFTISGQRRIRRLLDWLAKIEVDSVTVAIPYLAWLIKKNYPQLKIHASSFANIDSIQKAKYWQDLGVDLIVLEPTALNRDFSTLAKIRKQIKCKLELIANNACLYQCPLNNYHQMINAHASQSGDALRGYFINFCSLNCKYIRLKDTTNFIRSDWIRPEDVHYYEQLGIDCLKLAGRTRDKDFILNALDAYTRRRYERNLAELFPFYFNADYLSGKKGVKRALRGMRYFFHPFKANPFLILKISRALAQLEVEIDNRALDGFLDFFVKGNCRPEACEECGYCRKIAERAVKIDKQFHKKALFEYERAFNMLLHRNTLPKER